MIDIPIWLMVLMVLLFAAGIGLGALGLYLCDRDGVKLPW